MEPSLSAALALTTRAALLLRLPTTTTATALVFVHGWHGAVDAEGRENRAATARLPPLPPPRLAAAALFLATKASPAAVTVRTNDLVNAVACVAAEADAEEKEGCEPRRRGDGPTTTPPPPAFPPVAWAAVAGRPYGAAKAVLLADEALLLRGLRFRVAPQADAPARVALNAARLLGVGRAAAAGAAALAADALGLTPLPRTAGPVTIAAAALLVAGLAGGEEKIGAGSGDGALPAAHGRPPWWWEALGAPTTGVLAAAGEMVGALERVAAEAAGGGD